MSSGELTTAIAGYQVHASDGSALGEVEGVRPRGLRIHKITGHARHTGYLPVEAIDRIDKDTDTVVLRSGVTLDKVVGAPAPPDEGGEAWHMSDDWWADLLGHYGLFEPEGRTGEPFLHPDQK